MRNNGFTLAELLIALAVLGVIATFTIPKVLQSQSDAKYKSMAKEVVGMVSAAYETYKANNGASTSMTMGNLTPYMNYVKVDTASSVDFNNCGATVSCSGYICLKMHNGGMFISANGISFGASDALAGINWAFDPDGVASSTKGAEFWQYYNGMVRTRNAVQTDSHSSFNPDVDPTFACDPSWFDWN